jgi:hypothetical protein
VAQQHRDPTAGAILTVYLQEQATEFLRSLRLHRESGADVQEAAKAARALRCAARRIGGTLHSYRVLTDGPWADHLRTELIWLTTTLGREHAYAARLDRLLSALTRLSGTPAPTFPAPSPRTTSAATSRTCPEAHTRLDAADAAWAAEPLRPRAAGDGGAPGKAGKPPVSPSGAAGRKTPGETLTVGAARAAALLERRLTLTRTRAHSAALQALGSSRFHAVADAVALLASEVPLSPVAERSPAQVLLPLAAETERRMEEAVAALPLGRAGHPYNAEALMHGLAATPAADAPPASEQQDAPWHQVRHLLRMHQYAQEVLTITEADPVLDVWLFSASQALQRHRDAAEAAAAAAAAARTPRIAPATAYALGVLHADQRHEVEAARFAFYRVWQSQREAVNVP